MKKWEEKNKQRAHDNIVENAKSTIRRYSHSKQHGHGLNTSRAKNTPTNQNSYTSNRQLPINKILQIFELEQYAFLLAQYGFPYKLPQNSSSYIEDMLKRVDEYDQQRFLSLLNTLTVMSKDLKKPDRTPHATKSKKSIHYPPHSVSTFKQSPASLQKSQKTASKFRIKNTTGSNHQRQDLMRMKMRRPPAVQRQRTIPNKYNRKKSVSYSRGNAHDDFSVVHDFKDCQSGQIKPMKNSNHIIFKLVEKLKEIQTNSEKNIDDLHLEMQKIKDMYMSYDSAKITSNIVNIDLQLMIDCLAHEINNYIEKNRVHSLVKINEDKIKGLLKQSLLIIEKQQNNKNTQNTNEKTDINEIQFQSEQLVTSKKKIKINKKKLIEFETEEEVNQSIEIEDGEKNAKLCNSEICEVEEEQSHSKKIRESILDQGYDTDKSEGACSIQMAQMPNNSSSIWGNSYIESVINDFSCFDSTKENSEYFPIPQMKDIKNFIELVVMAGKMEKQIPIIAHVYLKRLLKMAKGSHISSKNWRNIILVLLIQASKIWDDQSLENHSFSKIIKSYTTLEINRLQKYLLFFLDYKTSINQKQYSESYFQLRKHVPQANSTANLMKLDLYTICKLQNTVNKTSVEKKQFLKKCMNKSF